MSKQRHSCASYVYINIEELGVSSALRKEGKAVDSNRCLILSELLDLNKVSISRVGTLTGEVGIGELKLWPKLSS